MRGNVTLGTWRSGTGVLRLANMITEQCFNCGACELVCPGEGIVKGEETFTVDPARCTECVGFYHRQQCARVCPIDCCVVDPNNVETEATLFERARKLHPGAGELELGPETSRFRAQSRTLASKLKRVGHRVNRALQGRDGAGSAYRSRVRDEVTGIGHTADADAAEAPVALGQSVKSHLSTDG